MKKEFILFKELVIQFASSIRTSENPGGHETEALRWPLRRFHTEFNLLAAVRMQERCHGSLCKITLVL